MAFHWISRRGRASRSESASETRYRRSPDVLCTSHGERTVLLDLGSEEYFGLDGVGASIWDLLENPRTVDELTTGLAEIYDASPAGIREDVVAFLGGLAKSRLVLEVRT